MKRIRAEALRDGFEVDTSCYPWIAYKGPRFQPTETKECLTDLEAELCDALCRFTDLWALEYLGADPRAAHAYTLALRALAKAIEGR